MKNHVKLLAILIIGVFFLAAATSVGATVFTLEDNNSTVVIDSASSSGMSEWTVDGTDQLYKQWFWYRVGDTAEASIDTLPLLKETVADFSLYTGNDHLSLIYGNDPGPFTIQVNYDLTGGSAGSFNSHIAETIKITNTGASSLDFHFYQYTDFDLNGTPNDDTAERINDNTIRQWDTGGGIQFGEVTTTTTPDHYQIDIHPNIINMLNDGDADDLLDITSPLGPDDITFAWQWDVTIGAGDNVIISQTKTMSPVPEPGTLLLIGLGFLGLGFIGLKKKELQ